MKYPYIASSPITGRVILFYSSGSGIVIENDGNLPTNSSAYKFKGKYSSSWDESKFTTCTARYLTAGKCIKILSHAHFEFVIEIANRVGYYFHTSVPSRYTPSKPYLQFVENHELRFVAELDEQCVEIELPLKNNMLSDEVIAPKVGDEVVIESDSHLRGSLVKITYMGNGVGCYIDLSSGNEYTFATNSIKFRKKITIEDEFICDLIRYNEADSCKTTVANNLLAKYNVTKRDDND